MEFTITTKQLIAAIWTLIAIVVSLVIVIAMGFPYYYWGSTGWILVALFFGILLVIVLPVYLLLALWQMLSKSDTA